MSGGAKVTKEQVKLEIDKVKPDLWTAIQTFRVEHDLSDLHADEAFADLRDRTLGREVELP